MNSRPQYLTKSRFKLALECPTKLYYTGKKDVYADQNEENEFLKALAKGGYQVGELAKYKYCDNPIGQHITVEEKGEEAVAITAEKLKSENAVIAEGAFRFENLYVRADIVVRRGNHIKLIEVKSKSWDSTSRFMNTKGNFESSWRPYLYDLAFQTHVLRNALPHFHVEPYLLLVDKDVMADQDSMNQWFRVKELADHRYEVITQLGLKRSQMGSLDLLREINMSREVEIAFNQNVPTAGVPEEYRSFEAFVQWCSHIYTNDMRHYSPVSNACKSCSFKSKEGDNKGCGFTECWTHNEWSIVGKVSATMLKEKKLVTELWLGHGGSTLSPKLYQNNVPFLDLVSLESLRPNNPTDKDYPGMSPLERRGYQIEASVKKTSNYIFLKTEFEQELQTWEWPLHMIDFETSTTSIPFFKGVHAYETIAFQFSHHILHRDGRVEHFNDWLSFQAGEYPNLEFLRALKTSLETQPGTIFRYSSHENTVLRHILQDVQDLNPDDSEDLIDFINDITQVRVKNQLVHQGQRNMVDLAAVVRSYYYSPYAKGSNSIKQILPAMLNDCKELKEMYSKPNHYGNGLAMHSRNFENHVWLQEKFGFDPYKTLPKIKDISDDIASNVFEDFDELGDGSAAMTAYNKLQYSHIEDSERETLAKALLNYCELDTLAMVIIIQGLLRLDERREYV